MNKIDSQLKVRAENENGQHANISLAQLCARNAQQGPVGTAPKSQVHNKHILRSNMSAKCTMREGMIDRPITLGRLGSTLAFPFRIAKSRQSSRSVHGGSGEPMFRYNSDAIDKERTMETCMTCREKEQNRLATENTSTERNSIGYADVQIKSARNGRRDSLIKSREQDTYNSASKVPKATPCGQSPMGTPNAQDIIIQRSQKCDRDAKYNSISCT